ncbi:hypothetical protein LOK49_LG10G01053 [Camellia lanceoleosa]|uniref:Uncharacterized protein n=1 Tax=Camellia lanceoleosa TaxID=1840588 RepID=A0ACC0GEG2_9ERIC|nr:hypothetical protein LOK49_LG10G01053 [Camellia lanceoleosa]
MADDASPSYTVPSNASQEAVDEIARKMVVETDHNFLEAYNSVKNGLESGLSGVNVLVNPEKVDKNAIKFKTKPLEHMDLMRRVYKGATATGKYAWTPGAAFGPVATDDGTSPMDEEDCEDSSGLTPFQPAAQREHTVHHTSAPENDMPTSVVGN